MITTHNKQPPSRTEKENSPNSAFSKLFRDSSGAAKNLAKLAMLSASLLIASCTGLQRTDIYHGQPTTPQATTQATVNPEARNRGKTVVISSIKDAKSEFFITMDDGWFTDPCILKFMNEQHVPITAFLISEAMKKHPGYWEAFRKYGGYEEDHTVDHPFLTKLAYPAILSEIKGSADYILHVTNERPAMMRPPYGSYNAEVLKAAAQAGIPYLVMWNKQIDNTRAGYTAQSLEKYRDMHIQGGDIVLLHWVPGQCEAVNLVIKKGADNGLIPGNLSNHLPQTEK